MNSSQVNQINQVVNQAGHKAVKQLTNRLAVRAYMRAGQGDPNDTEFVTAFIKAFVDGFDVRRLIKVLGHDRNSFTNFVIRHTEISAVHAPELPAKITSTFINEFVNAFVTEIDGEFAAILAELVYTTEIKFHLGLCQTITLQDEIANLQRELNDAIDQNKKNLAITSHINNLYHDTIVQKKKENITLTSALDAKGDAIAALTSALDAKDDTIAVLQADIAKLRADIAGKDA